MALALTILLDDCCARLPPEMHPPEILFFGGIFNEESVKRGGVVELGSLVLERSTFVFPAKSPADRRREHLLRLLLRERQETDAQADGGDDGFHGT